jgi:hypothetical protein
VPNDARNEVEIGDMPTLVRCVECGELFKTRSREGQRRDDCTLWKHHQAKKEKHR